jgi:transposase-like protein
MKNITPKLFDLVQYLQTLGKINYEVICESCGCNCLHKHGYYYRKADRLTRKLNPIPIQRLKCSNCGKTCSILPECIPPHRWYLWEIQQAVFLLVLSGKSYRNIAKEVIPCRKTISRWVSRFKEQFKHHADCIKSFCADMGRFAKFEIFWEACLKRWQLSTIMLTLNNSGVIVP